jgi:hypothetical protein
MKWFKHDSDANMDAKLQEVLLDYGLEGYGLYWYCLELVATNVTSEKLTFELEHDCRVIARNTGSTVQRVQEMMKKFIDLDLFNNCEGRVFCLKLAQRCDDFTAKAVRKKIDKLQLKHVVGESPTKSEKVPLEVEVEVEVEDKNILSSGNDQAASKGKYKFDKERFKLTWNMKADKHGLPQIRSITDSVEKGVIRIYKSHVKQCKEVGEEPNDIDTVVNGYIEFGYVPTAFAMGDNPEGKKYGIATALTQKKIDEILGAG